MSDIDQLIESFVNAVSELSRVNRLTGIWDNRRFQECKKPLEQVDTAYLYLSEKMSRKNVELRAVHRLAIDDALEGLFAAIGKNKQI